VIAVDSSVAIAAFASWNEHNKLATDFLSGKGHPVLPSHAALETYSVLTRLPQPYRAPPEVVGAFLDSWFEGDLPQLSPIEHTTFRRRLVALGIAGGAVYDALIAETALRAGAVLATLDKRALRVYEMVGVEVQTLAQ
jgi:predicted nucleic acid-binding protein